MRFAVVVLALVLFGCSDKAGGKSPEGNTPRGGGAPITGDARELAWMAASCQSGEDVQICYKRKCEEAGGVIDPLFRACDCGTGHWFDSRLVKCVPVRVANRCPDNQENCELSIRAEEGGLYSPIGTYSKSEAVAAARFLQRGEALRWMAAGSKGLETARYLRSVSGKLDREEVEFAIQNTGSPGVAVLGYRFFEWPVFVNYQITQSNDFKFFERSKDEVLENLVDVIRSAEDQAWFRDDAISPTRESLRALLDMPTKGESVFLQGCLRSCVLTAEKNGLQFRRTFVAGGLEVHDLVLLSKSGYPELVLRLNSSMEPLFWIQIERELNGSASVVLKNQVTLRDLLGNEIGQSTQSFEAFEDAVPLESSSDQPSVVLLDGGLRPEEFRSVVRRGPFGSNSVLGYVESDDLIQKTLGTFGFVNWMGLRNARFSEFEHGAGSTEIITGRWQGGISDVSIIPISLESVASNPAAVTKLISSLPKDLKVGNLSAGFSPGMSGCLGNGSVGRVFVESPLLWTVSAGNGGSSIDRQKPLLSCNPSLAGYPNIIIVGGVNGDRLDPISDHGELYADIGADTHPPSVYKTPGTSWAAPRVARLAAKLSHNYPELSPQQIRAAILVGGRMVEGLPFRSRAVLNSEGADLVASMMDWKNLKKLDETLDALKRLQRLSKRDLEFKKTLALELLSGRKQRGPKNE